MRIEHFGTKLSFGAELTQNEKEIRISFGDKQVYIKCDKKITEFIPSIEGEVMVCFCQPESEPYVYDVKTGNSVSMEELTKMNQTFVC